MRAPIKTDAEFEAVLAHTESMERPEMYRLMMLLSIRLGLRPIEIAALDTSWFSPTELRIPIGYSKRGKGRSLPMNNEILDALGAHMGMEQGRVFRNARGEAFDANGISMAMRRLYKRAGVEGSAYSGRRTAATKLVDKGVSIRIVQEFLGHTNLATTANYCSVTPQMLQRAVFG